MALYESELSNFPNTKIVLHNFKNINNDDNNIIDLINKIDTARKAGDYKQAQTLLTENETELSQYIVDAVTFRTWEEEIYNTQIYARQMQQTIHFGEDIPDCCENDIWITGGESGAV